MPISSASLEPQMQAIELKPTLGEQQQRLNIFVGRWTAEGHTVAGSSGASEIMTHQHTYEWLSGGFHLFHRWDGKIGPLDSKGVEIIGYDASSNCYEAHFFDSDGWARVYQGRARDRVWTFTGARERCSLLFDPDGTTMTIHWDRSADGVTWEPLCDVKAIKS
jgi:hypothetical protein